MKQQYIYIVISKTQTKFARCIRRFGKLDYNHAAIGLDCELKNLYAFARPQHHSVFRGRLVRETLDRYTLRKNCPVPAVVFRVPVSQEEYDNVYLLIKQISRDSEYMYNLLSVLTYPITHGFSIYKAFTCTEFVFYVLKVLKYPLDEKICKYTPDDLLKIFHTSILFKGDLRDYMICDEVDDNYFAPLGWKMLSENLYAMIKIIGRSWKQIN